MEQKDTQRNRLTVLRIVHRCELQEIVSDDQNMAGNR